MAEILATFGTAFEAVTIFSRYVLTPSTNQFSYLCSYNGNIQRLRDHVVKLNMKRSDLQLRVDEAKRNVEVIGSDVEEWIEAVGKINEKKEKIIEETAEVQQGCFHGTCPNIKLKYRLSREAKKTAEAAQGLLQEVNKFITISYHTPLEPIPIASASVEINSRKSKEDEIMEALTDDNVYVVALCGMGGVGKTTMARKIESKVREGNIFEVVVMVVVSRPLELKNVQQGIAEGLSMQLHEQTIPARAQRLHQRLKETKSVLLILDDVWEKFNLQEIGIPSKTTHQRCKIILTSRIQHVCRNIEASTKIIQLDALPEQEAWNLFKEKVGDMVDEPILNPIARDVARDCKGLPLALVTVAAALRQLSMPSWKDALHQLKASLATDIPEVHQEVYLPLKWSYDQLQNEEARYLFLLCCLYPEDYEICLHELVEYGFALRIFANTVCLEEARNRVYRLVEMLIDRFLLIRVDLDDSDFEYFMRYRVKMHDVIRDMAISIASKDKHVFMVMHDNNIRKWPKKDSYDNYTCISLSSEHRIAFPENIYFPRLELLRVCTKGMEIQESSFNGMIFPSLKVLHTRKIQSLPSSLSWAMNLRSLFLVKCKLKILPNEIGELVNLEILSLYNSRIKMLPKEIGRLKNLRSLDLTKCRYLEMIPPGAISGLVQLEELYMWPFNNWKGVEDTNASISEVASLTNLTSLQCKVKARSIKLLQDSGNWHKLTRYNVVIGANHMEDWQKFDRSIKLRLLKFHPLTDLVQVLFNNAQAVELEGSGSTRKLSRNGYEKVERLVLSDQDMKFLFDSNSWNLPNTSFLPCLRTLVLNHNGALKEICHGQPPTGSFSNLTSITLFRCNGLKNLFCVSVLAMLTMLEFLEIEGCDIIEAVFFEQNRQYGDNAIINKITFPRLSKIRLYSLPSLSAFCETIDHVAIEFPQLHAILIEKCRRLKSFRTIDRSHLSESEQNVEEQFVFDQKVMFNFNSLERMRFMECRGCENLFFNSMSRAMHNLKDLHVEDIRMLRQVIATDEEEQTNSKVTLFPQLKKLQLLSLPMMQQFCHMSRGIELPSLEVLLITNCGLMKTFSRNQFNLTSDSNFVVQSFFDEVTCSKLKILRLLVVEGATELFGRKISIGNFSGLQHITIWGGQKFRSIFSPGMFKGLMNLQYLFLWGCPKLQEVISKDEKEDETSTVKETIFPQLRRLTLIDLPKLIRFCHIKNDLELPSLSLLHIQSCPMLKTFSLGSLHLPPTVSFVRENLESVEDELSEENFKSQFLSNKQAVNNEEREVTFGDGNNAEEDHSD